MGKRFVRSRTRSRGIGHGRKRGKRVTSYGKPRGGIRL